MPFSEFERRNVLVIGATGFIGSHLAQALTQRGANVICVSRNIGGAASENLPEATWHQCDAARREDVAAVIDRFKPDLIYHLTSDSKGGRELSLIPDSLQNDVMATVNVLLEAARAGGIHVVLAGSFEEPSKNDPFPCSPYAAAKATATSYARMVSALSGLPVSILRLMMVYGPGQKGYKVFPYVIGKLRTGEAAELGPAERLLDWVFIDDVVEAFLKIGSSPWTNADPIDIGSGTLMRLRDCIEIIGDVMGRPELLKFGALVNRALEREQAADLSAARLRLRWEPRTSFHDGIRMTIASMTR